MKKEDLAEVIGNINEKHVAEARAEHKVKKLAWLKWGAVAACLCLVVAGAFVMRPDNDPDDDTGVSASVADVAPMVCVDNVLYKQSAKQISYTERQSAFIYVGKIESDITKNQSAPGDGVPTENFQANHPIVGAEVYQYGNDVVIQIHGEYWLYEVLGEANNTNAWDNLSEEEKMQLDPTYHP